MTSFRQAMSRGAITLMTRDYGRGTDFICYDQRLIDAGGVHVLQTFLSEQVSEEIQIKGRTARQGNQGSYSMILCEDELSRFGFTTEDLEAMQKSSGMYEKLDKKRREYFSKQYNKQIEKAESIAEHHKKSEAFVKDLLAGRRGAVADFLESR